MPFVPWQRFVFDSPAAPEEVHDRLLAATGPGLPFIGTVSQRSFKVRPAIQYRNSFVPFAVGSFGSGVDGTRVDVRLRLNRAVAAVMAFWFAVIAAFLVVAVVVASRNPSNSWFVLVVVAFIAFGYGLVMFGFSLEARRTRANLALLIVSGAPPGELSSADLSFFSNSAPSDAEPRDRRFNSIFTVLGTVTGVLVWLAFERRRFTAWPLGLILVGAGFAFRFALLRRKRRAYVPLMVVVVAVAIASAWLIVHPSP